MGGYFFFLSFHVVTSRRLTPVEGNPGGWGHARNSHSGRAKLVQALYAPVHTHHPLVEAWGRGGGGGMEAVGKAETSEKRMHESDIQSQGSYHGNDSVENVPVRVYFPKKQHDGCTLRVQMTCLLFESMSCCIIISFGYEH